MNEIENILKEKPIVLPRYLFNYYLRLGITPEELIILIFIMDKGNKVIYNPLELSEELGMDKFKVMELLNSLNENIEIILFLDDQFDNKNNSEAITWIYDTDFELLNKPNIKRIIVGGVRNKDYKLRLLLAGIDKEKIFTCEKETDAINFVTTKDIDKIFILNEVYYITGGIKMNEKIVEKIKKENL